MENGALPRTRPLSASASASARPTRARASLQTWSHPPGAAMASAAWQRRRRCGPGPRPLTAGLAPAAPPQVQGGPAQRAGVRAGDVIRKVDGKSCEGTARPTRCRRRAPGRVLITPRATAARRARDPRDDRADQGHAGEHRRAHARTHTRAPPRRPPAARGLRQLHLLAAPQLALCRPLSPPQPPRPPRPRPRLFS